MKKIALAAVVSLTALAFAPAANAVVLNFDDLTTPSFAFFTSDYQGFRFGNNNALTNDWVWNTAAVAPPSIYPLPAGSTLAAVGFDAAIHATDPGFNADAVESLPVTMASGSDFYLSGAFFSGYSTDSLGNAAQIRFKLYNNNVLVGTTLNLTPNSIAAQFLSTGLLSTMAIDAFTVVGPASYFVMDNLEVTPVPEPSAYALMLMGLAGVGVMVRRRTKS